VQSFNVWTVDPGNETAEERGLGLVPTLRDDETWSYSVNGGFI